MPRDLKISIGQHSDKGRKESNQDFHGAMIPRQPVLGAKGIAVSSPGEDGKEGTSDDVKSW